MTLEWIIKRLKTDGQGSKQEVLKALENANTKELRELYNSLKEKISEQGKQT